MLIFVAGMSEIQKIVKAISRLNEKDEFFLKYPVFVCGLNGDMVKAGDPMIDLITNRDIDQVRVWVDNKQKRATRRITVATNVAETGITINTLRYVISTGYSNSSEYNPDFDVTLFVPKPVTQSMQKQQTGRVGRKHPGDSYMLYPEEVFNAMITDQYPAIVKSEITGDILNILVKYFDPDNKSMDYNAFMQIEYPKFADSSINMYELDLLDIPPANNMHVALEKLYILGGINENCVPTKLGFLMAKFRFITMECTKMILSGYAWDVCVADLITIAAFVTGKSSIKDKDFINKRKEHMFSLNFIPGLSQTNDKYNTTSTDMLLQDEFIENLLIFHEIRKNATSGLRDWCEQNGIVYSGVLAALEIRDSALYTLATLGFNPWSGKYRFDDIISDACDFSHKLECIKAFKRCIYEGFKMNMCTYDKEKQAYFTISGLQVATPEMLPSPIACKIYGDQSPNYIMYASTKLHKPGMAIANQITLQFVSVIDGYIDIDPNFDAVI